MPNDCYNGMEVSGTPEALQQFKDSLALPNIKGESVPFAFSQLVPVPEDQKNNWYEWCYANWSTNWEPYDVDISIFEKSVEISFYTAWGPPINWIRAVCKKIPDLVINLNYEEPGMDLYGEISAGGDYFSDCANEAPEE